MVKRHLLILAFLAMCAIELAAQDVNEDLLEAVRQNDATRIEALIAKGANVNASWRYGETPLFFACDRGFTQVVKVLLEHGAEVNIKDTFYGMTPVMRAAGKDHVDIVKMLLAKGASADSVLMMGADDGKPDLVKAALDSGKVKKESLSWALSAANREKHPEVAELLKAAGATPLPPANYAVDAETLSRYAGRYQGGRGGTEMEVSFEVKDGKLVGDYGSRLTFAAVNKTRFRGVEYEGVEIDFKVEDGKVTGFTLLQGGDSRDFTRVVKK
jgi:ankyrin repeat protein